MNNLKDETLRPWLAFFHLPQLKLNQKHGLLDHWGSPQAFLDAGERQWSCAKISPRAINCLTEFRREPVSSKLGRSVQASLDWQSATGRKILCLDDPGYPALLKEITCPPLLLFVDGDAQALLKPQIAIVGSRNSSAQALETAYGFARQLAESGIVITSGMARGVDAASHKGAISRGQSIAVMATGADIIYPREHRELAAEIRQRGALVTEFPLGTTPLPPRFPQRNRIISGLSWGTLVVAAAAKSGSLITAKYALEQGREVFAIPHSIHQATAKGCHQLLKSGAKLVESVADIFEELPCLPARERLAQPAGTKEGGSMKLSSIERKVIKLLDFQATSFDILLNHSGLATDELTRTLVRLELKSLVTASDGGYVKVRAKN